MKNRVIDPEELENELFTEDDDDFDAPIEDLGGLDEFSDFDEDDDY